MSTLKNTKSENGLGVVLYKEGHSLT